MLTLRQAGRSAVVFCVASISCLLGATKLGHFNINPGAHEMWQRLFEHVYAPQVAALVSSHLGLSPLLRVLHHQQLRVFVGSLEFLCGVSLFFGSRASAWVLSLLSSGLCAVCYSHGDIDGLSFPLLLTALCVYLAVTAAPSKNNK